MLTMFLLGILSGFTSYALLDSLAQKMLLHRLSAAVDCRADSPRGLLVFSAVAMVLGVGIAAILRWLP